MARIRSVHPGIWTDEAFVSVSPHARLLFIGLWNEADDQGVFAWKPVTLKMRLAPADNVDPEVLLKELLAHQMVMRFDHDGQAYGAVRNFRRYQRPQKPNAIHPLPAEAAAFVGPRSSSRPEPEDNAPTFDEQSPSDPRPVHDQSPSGQRNSEQRKEEGGRREEGVDTPPPSLRSGGGSSPPPAGGGDPTADPADEKAAAAKVPRAPPHPPMAVLNEMAAVWNDVAADHGLAQVREITDQRAIHLRARCRERWTTDPVRQFRAYVTRICRSEFLTGGGPRGWKASFDWALQPRNVLAVAEGKYHDGDNDDPSAIDVEKPTRYAGGMPV